MNRRIPYKRGSKGLLYINKDVSDGLIEFINSQSQLNGVLLLGLKHLADQYGTVDLIRQLPRTFELESEINGEYSNQQPRQAPNTNMVVQTPIDLQTSPVSQEIDRTPPSNTGLDGAKAEELMQQLLLLQQQITMANANTSAVENPKGKDTEASIVEIHEATPEENRITNTFSTSTIEEVPSDDDVANENKFKHMNEDPNEGLF